MTEEYQAFLESKAVIAPETGYDGPLTLNPNLKPTLCMICGDPVLRQPRHGIAKGRHLCEKRECRSKMQQAINPLPVSKEWLEQKYLRERMSCPAIASLFGLNPTSVHAWLLRYGIPTRKRGQACPENHFVQGHISTFDGSMLTDESREKIRQATIARGGQPYLKNGVHWLRQPGARPANWKGGITPERQTFYRSEEWKKASRAVWKRDAGRCRLCCRGCDEIGHDRRNWHIHHIDSFMIVDRRAEVDNLVLLCKLCHYWVHGVSNWVGVFLGLGQTGGVAA
jgi:HNH endonuclease